MTNSLLKEVAGRLGPVQDVSQNQSGSKEHLVLHATKNDAPVIAVKAALVLAECGISLLKAKRAIETVLEGGEATLILPKVGSKQKLTSELRAAGIEAFVATPPKTYSVKGLRQRLKLTQEEFAVIYGVDLRTLQNYESGARKPDRTAIGYFKLIEKAPEVVKQLRFSA
ncbi:helix-turn-helix domain-containing protein [Paracoccus fontiphilus]|uniref:Helix-turn-helix domain-containing protein n=1 Tax=Paracoccus fontiphilus TaxID=1815556 RepID=A0ABV7IK92_9RHOB